jgi:predicted nucleic acid-binding protein
MKPSFVLDCSVTMAWCFLDEATPTTVDLFHRAVNDSALVPYLWYLEVTNTLMLSERKARLNFTQVIEFIALIQSFDIEVDTQDTDQVFASLFPLCRSHGLTSYDAVYLDLAMRRQLPLATLDESLRKAAKKAGVKVLGK